VATFLPAQLAEDMHDVDHMIIKYEQGWVCVLHVVRVCLCIKCLFMYEVP
jgi:hypothetical protein